MYIISDGVDKGRVATEIEGFGGVYCRDDRELWIPMVFRHYDIYTSAQ